MTSVSKPAEWTWGTASMDKVRTVPLWWNAVPLAVHSNGRLVQPVTRDWMEAQGCGGDVVYALEALHDSQRGRSVLYIGESTRGSDRLPESLGKFIDGHYGALFSDCTDVVVRWSSVDASVREDVEAVLIAAHAPGFNNQAVRKKWSRSQLTVFSAGAKGALLGVVDSRYFTESGWPSSPP